MTTDPLCTCGDRQSEHVKSPGSPATKVAYGKCTHINYNPSTHEGTTCGCKMFVMQQVPQRDDKDDARVLLRASGLCGRVDIDNIAGPAACILPIGHDDGKHERGWTYEKKVESDFIARDSRESITIHRVSNHSMYFDAGTEAQAKWLVDALTRAETLDRRNGK